MKFYILNKDSETEKYIAGIRKADKDGKIVLDNICICENDPIVFFSDLIMDLEKNKTIVDDQLIPSHNAPHILAKIFMTLIERAGFVPELIPFEGEIGAPFEWNLKSGIKAFSVTDEKCPELCREEVCSTKNMKREWDLLDYLKKYSKSVDLQLVSFRCAHFMNDVATIPVNSIVSAWHNLKESNLTSKKHLIATLSYCHGIAALIKVN